MLGTQHNRVQIHKIHTWLCVPLCFAFWFAHFFFVVRFEVFATFSTASVFFFSKPANTIRSFVQCLSSATFHFQLEGWIFNLHKYFPPIPYAQRQVTLSQKLYGIGKYLPWALQLSKNTLVFPVIVTQKVCFFVPSLMLSASACMCAVSARLSASTVWVTTRRSSLQVRQLFPQIYVMQNL